MDTDSKFGKTDPNMMASGKLIKQTAKESLSMLMETYMKVSG
jgi:hypothetical protein